VFDSSGLSAPVPRGRKGRRGGKKVEVATRKSMFSADLSKIDINPNVVLADIGYRKHLERHAIKLVIPAKAFARDYVITGVGCLSVCLSVCFFVCLLPDN